jgi:restriction endonuclease S subunit
MSPFDKARYERLLEGLELTEIRFAEVLQADSVFRIDSEFFRSAILRAKDQLERQAKVRRLGDISPAIEHPIEVTRSYSDGGGYRVLLAQEVRNNILVLSEGSFLDDPIEAFLKKNKLKRGDIVLTRTGANFGQCAPVLVDATLYACADLLILRKGLLPAEYVSTVLNTAHGRLVLDRGAYGMAQPHIAPTYLRGIPIPVFDRIVQPIKDVVQLATHARDAGLAALRKAEQTLLHALGLDTWTPPEALSYVRSSRQAFAAGRLDAQFFAPRVEQLLARLGRDGLRLSDVAPARHERFEPSGSGDFDYIEIGSLGADGTAASESVPMAEAPSRATQYVRAGDVITSTVRPIRRLSALVAPEQDGAVCSSGFVVLRPRSISGEVLLTYLRLPLVCELMDLHTSATMYPAISESDLLALPIPAIAPSAQAQVQHAVRQSAQARQRAAGLLDAAKRAVEIAIEDSEAAALAHLAAANPPAPAA